ncbi:MAG: hypothetical protein KDN19_16805 [Verrucomicrobiae bacterium]|nr:hypothetical protein [Verrucomicrobiae bacterium]
MKPALSGFCYAALFGLVQISNSADESIIPAIAEYRFTLFEPSEISPEALPEWAGTVQSEDGEFDSGNGYWRAAAELPSGMGKLVVDLDRTILQQDLALSLTYQSTADSDFSVQLLDGEGKTVAVDLFQNVVALGREAQTDTFIVPLLKYPNAEKLAIRRVTGEVRIHGFVLYPVVGEIQTEAQSHAEIASLFGDPLSDRNSLRDALASYVPKDASETKELRQKLKTIPGAPAIDFGLVKPAVNGVMLSSPEGEPFSGHQLEFFQVSSDGSLTCREPAWINLYRTEGRSFRLSGEVMLAPESADNPLSDAPHGFALFLREFDSLHRYNANSVGMRVKRRLLEGEQIKQFVRPFVFKPLEPARWHKFSAEVRPEFISFSLGNQIGMIRGPLGTDGANKIVLTPGASLRNLRIVVFP